MVASSYENSDFFNFYFTFKKKAHSKTWNEKANETHTLQRVCTETLYTWKKIFLSKLILIERETFYHRISGSQEDQEILMSNDIFHMLRLKQFSPDTKRPVSLNCCVGFMLPVRIWPPEFLGFGVFLFFPHFPPPYHLFSHFSSFFFFPSPPLSIPSFPPSFPFCPSFFSPFLFLLFPLFVFLFPPISSSFLSSSPSFLLFPFF